MRVNDILSKLQNALNTKLSDLNPVELDEFGPGFINQYPPESDSDGDIDNDLQGVDTPYTTNIAIPVPKGKKGGSNYLPFESSAIRAIKEAEEDEKEKVEKEVEVDDTPPEPEEMPDDQDMNQNIGGMDQGMNQGMDQGMGMGMGMGTEEEPKTAGQLGRIYELKKIYARLTAIELYLASESSKELLQVRGYVSQSIELFEVISANFDSYLEKLDEIIVMFYKFILEVYSIVKDYYKKEAEDSGDI